MFCLSTWDPRVFNGVCNESLLRSLHANLPGSLSTTKVFLMYCGVLRKDIVCAGKTFEIFLPLLQRSLLFLCLLVHLCQKWRNLVSLSTSSFFFHIFSASEGACDCVWWKPTSWADLVQLKKCTEWTKNSSQSQNALFLWCVLFFVYSAYLFCTNRVTLPSSR